MGTFVQPLVNRGIRLLGAMLNREEDFSRQQSTSATASQETQLSSSSSTEERIESSQSKTEESNWHASATVGGNFGLLSASAPAGGGSATSSFSDEVAEVVDFPNDIASNALQP